jgi:hypothetical protein
LCYMHYWRSHHDWDEEQQYKCYLLTWFTDGCFVMFPLDPHHFLLNSTLDFWST